MHQFPQDKEAETYGIQMIDYETPATIQEAALRQEEETQSNTSDEEYETPSSTTPEIPRRVSQRGNKGVFP